MNRSITIGVIITVLMFCSVPVFATTLTANLTADDTFSMYISTADNVLGTLIGSDPQSYGSFSSPESFTTALTSGTYYIHIVAKDIYGGWAAFLGDFSLSDSDYKFVNGTQHILTNIDNWKVYVDSFGGTQGTVKSQGKNGIWPWYGPITNISTDAEWIWSDATLTEGDTVYFSTTISVNSPTSAVPEPSTCILLGAGLAGFGYMRRRNKM